MAGRGHERSEHGLDELSIRLPTHRDGDGHAHDDMPLIYRKVKKTAALPTRSRDMVFASLHHHSTFSYGDGYQLPSAHIRRAVEIGMDTLALTEHGNISSHVQLEGAAKKAGIKPIFGVELYTGEVGENATQRKNHLTVLAESATGYQNLLRLVSSTFAEGFHYEPTADGKMLVAHKEGLVVLSGCQGSALFTACVGGKHIAEEDASYVRARRVASQFKRQLGDAYYIEVQAFPELDKTRQANPLLARIAEELGISLVVTFDCHYTIPEEKEIQKILHNLRPGEKRSVEDMAREWGYNSNLCPPWTDAMIVRKLMGTGLTKAQSIKAILNTREIADRCTVELPRLPMVRYPLPAGYDSAVDLWRDEIRKGWKYRGIDHMSPDKVKLYKERVQREAKVIEDKDFVDYFLVIGDVVRWTKDHDIAVGPARGSSAGSLLCWLLRITEVDPMLYEDLVFERFIDVTREDLPDVDIDFSSDRRNEVYDYFVSKYGRDRVSNVGTFTKYKGKNSLDAAARVFRVPTWEVEKIKEVLIERSSGDLRASATLEDTAEQFPAARDVFERYPDLGAALDLEGNYAGFGIHSAGIVISTGPITDVAAFYERTVKGEKRRVISMDKYDAEKQGLLKIDALGLATTQALDHMRKEMGWDLDTLYNLPLDDAETLRGFHENDVMGIFQFEGRACRYVCGALQPENFKHVYDVTALGRPGPLHNGSCHDYIDIKWGRKEPEVLHSAVEAICHSTYGQIVYQEQILRILGDVFGFDWTHRAEVRRIISKKHGDQEFNRKWAQALDGARSLHGMDEQLARLIWMKLITAGSYAFNASHAVSYGLIANATMWFKRHHPEIFYMARLNTITKDKERVQILLRDSQRFGRKTEIKPPHPAVSGIGWTRKGSALQAGFSQVEKIGEAIAQNVIDYRESGGILNNMEDLIKVKGIGKVTLERIKSMTDRGDDPFGALWLDRAIAHVKAEIAAENLPVPMPTHVALDLPYDRGKDISLIWLGTVQTRNERDLFEFNQAKGAELDMSDPKHPRLNGELVRDPHLNKWVVMVADDETDQVILRIDRWKYPKMRERVWKIRPGKDLILVRGVKPGYVPTRQINISELWIIDPEM